MEEGYNTVDDSWSDATNNLSLNQQLQSTGVFIADNTYDSDTETYLQLQGASNVTHDFSDYWYRKFQADTNYFDPMEFFIKNSVSYLTNVNHYQNEGNISRIARGGNFGNLMFNYTIKQSNSTWLMINDSETYELKLFNLTEPNNDIINLSDGSVLEYSASSYAINLSYGGGISLGSYADTVDPFWLQTPINISWDNATSLSIQYNASDDVLVDKYFMNESTYFSLTDTGLFTNNSGVSEGNYSINISVNDTSGNSISEVFTIEVLYTDVSLPIWLQTPTNFSSSNESAILVDYNASDDVAIDEYWVDNANFSINSSGYFQNATILSLGNYSVNISVNDSANNVLSEVIVVTIYHDDVTVPIWTVEPVDINVYSDELVGEQYSASDNVAIDSYYLNDSTNFVINSSGYFKNSSSLVVGTYNVLISVNDTDNNTISKAITITITTRPTSAPVGGGGGGGSNNVAVLSKKDCNISIEPEFLEFSEDSLRLDIIVFNPQPFQYKANWYLNRTSGDDVTEYIKTEEQIVVDAKNNSNEVVFYDAGFFGLTSKNGTANLTFVSNNCKDVVVPVKVNIDYASENENLLKKLLFEADKSVVNTGIFAFIKLWWIIVFSLLVMFVAFVKTMGEELEREHYGKAFGVLCLSIFLSLILTVVLKLLFLLLEVII